MKKALSIILLMLFCLSLTSCAEAFTALRHTITGDIIDPADGFSRGEEGTLIYKDKKYILVKELKGNCDIDITDEDILLGQSSNFPVFPNSSYYVSTDDNPSFIIGGTTSAMRGSFVYTREDLYNGGIVYVIDGGSFEFELSSAFIKTDKVEHSVHIKENKYKKSLKIDFYVKDVPKIAAFKWLYLIDDVWYCVEVDESYQLSDDFVRKLTEEGILN